MRKKLLAVALMLFAPLALAAVDVNQATEAQLDGVKGVGPATSRLIMAERRKGEFRNWDDFIGRVQGMGAGRAGKLSAEGLTVNGAAYPGASATGKDEKARK